MRNSLMALAAGWLVLTAAQNPAAASPPKCPVGSQQTLTGVMMLKLERSKDGKEWVYDLVLQDTEPCTVDKLRGKALVQCRKHGRYTVTGRVVGTGMWPELLVASMRCL